MWPKLTGDDVDDDEDDDEDDELERDCVRVFERCFCVDIVDDEYESDDDDDDVEYERFVAVLRSYLECVPFRSDLR